MPIPGLPEGVQFPLAVAGGRGPDAQITFARNTDTFSSTVGVDGDATANRSNDKTALGTLVLTDGAPFNTTISALQFAQEDESIPFFTLGVTVVDNNATPPTIANGTNCTIQRPADYEAGATDGTNPWVFMAHGSTIVHNGRVF